MIAGQSESKSPFLRSSPIVFLTIHFVRSLYDRNPTILFYDRWPIVFCFIVGLSESYDPVFSLVSRPFLTIPGLRCLTARNPTIPLYDRWTIVFNDPFVNDRWPIGMQRSFFTIVGQSFFYHSYFTIFGRSESNDPFLRSLAYPCQRPNLCNRWPIRIQRSRIYDR